MRVDSLEELGAAFGEWRSKKKHRRDETPEGLVKRARRAAGVHGPGEVTRAVGIDVRRLREVPGSRKKVCEVAAPPPLYSRVQLVASSATRPFAELEMPSGIKLRVYTQTPEALRLLSSVCSGGGR